MARRRRPGSRTAVVDGRAEIIIPLESVTDVDGAPMTFRAVSKRLHRVETHPCIPSVAEPAVAVVLDRFAWDLHLADIAHSTDTHDGDAFFEAARSAGTIAVFVIDGLDPRRSTAADFEAAAHDGRVVGGLVSVYTVDALQS